MEGLYGQCWLSRPVNVSAVELVRKGFQIRRGKDGDPIAVIDFVTTVRATANSARYKYKWKERRRFVFEDYIYDDKGEIKLRSGLVEDAVDEVYKHNGERRRKRRSKAEPKLKRQCSRAATDLIV